MMLSKIMNSANPMQNQDSVRRPHVLATSARLFAELRRKLFRPNVSCRERGRGPPQPAEQCSQEQCPPQSPPLPSLIGCLARAPGIGSNPKQSGFQRITPTKPIHRLGGRDRV